MSVKFYGKEITNEDLKAREDEMYELLDRTIAISKKFQKYLILKDNMDNTLDNMYFGLHTKLEEYLFGDLSKVSSGLEDKCGEVIGSGDACFVRWNAKRMGNVALELYKKEVKEIKICREKIEKFEKIFGESL